MVLALGSLQVQTALRFAASREADNPDIKQMETYSNTLYIFDCNGSMYDRDLPMIVPTCLFCRSTGGYHMVGRARTVEVDGDFLEVLVALREAQPGEAGNGKEGSIGMGRARRFVVGEGVWIKMIKSALVWPQTGGLFGELLANEAQRRRLSGLVIDGNCRDTPLLRQRLGRGEPTGETTDGDVVAHLPPRAAPKCRHSQEAWTLPGGDLTAVWGAREVSGSRARRSKWRRSHLHHNMRLEQGKLAVPFLGEAAWKDLSGSLSLLLRRSDFIVEIQMGGVSIQPGDFVLGDDDGLVVCRPRPRKFGELSACEACDYMSRNELNMEEKPVREVECVHSHFGSSPFLACAQADRQPSSKLRITQA
ncbi:unnamed protein product [Durusdinium trenchii]|uniref:4-hydroxy-4-methyl-2-oxoglutarate aldolase n=1 Tax=Durusdinium trenchii TaxID=1381693 RepID=A0ABP0S632_9DINO